VASSAAIEVAAMRAIDAAYGVGLEGLDLARLCQIVENRVVGAPCGIMDQVTCALGRQGALLALRCQPHDVLGFHVLPAGCQVVGINSKVKHAVGGRRYARARVGAFMGLTIIQRHLGGDPFGGCLANITPRQFRSEFHALLPARLRGADFLRQYGETPDPVTEVDPDETYSVRACTAHPIYENDRVQRFVKLLGEAHGPAARKALRAAGRLMYASHWSYGKLCALGSAETDLLTQAVRRRGPDQGLYGAKITGGGSGGTVAILAAADAGDVLREIAVEYERRTGIRLARADLMMGSSPGALAMGHVRVPVPPA
jgi:L-arabinokinase